MFNRDALFGKKDEPQQRNEPRPQVNVTPGLGSSSNTPTRPQPPAEPPKPDLRFAEIPRTPPPQPQPRSEETVGSRLIVGPDIKLRGVEIMDCDTLVVEGRVEAAMDSRVIQIAENGVFSGTVSIDVAEIRGRFEGELTARKQLVIYATGRVSGQIHYGKIRIEEGGEISGQISTLSKMAAGPSREGPASSSPNTATSGAGGSAVAAGAAPATQVTSGTPGATVTRPPQPAIQSSADAPPDGAAAVREPAPSRLPKPGARPNSPGVNTV